MHMIPVGADLQELELIASLDPQTDVSQRLVDRRIEHGSSIFGWKHQVVEQNRNVMALVDVEAHPRDLRRKRRGMHPKGFNNSLHKPVAVSGRSVIARSTLQRCRTSSLRGLCYYSSASVFESGFRARVDVEVVTHPLAGT